MPILMPLMSIFFFSGISYDWLRDVYLVAVPQHHLVVLREVFEKLEGVVVADVASADHMS